VFQKLVYLVFQRTNGFAKQGLGYKVAGHMKFLPILFLASLLCLLAGCASVREKPDQRSFLSLYQPYCGQSFEGRSTLVNLTNNRPFEGALLRMTVALCEKDEVRIRFFVDEDASRTWILRQTAHGLHLSHDHRYPDGTEHPQNLYGGYADERGTPTRQFFPADPRTIQDRPAREINVWSKEFDLENARYYYRLYLQGELRYEAEFDLSRPLRDRP
jgi:hypothetical protein